jgi:2'-hydroxyisoflavone reductase
LNLLVIGGMRFTGRAVVAAALARGHRVTLFNRGQSDAPPAGVERIAGDRDGGLDSLGPRAFDAVIDTSGYFPRVVRASAERVAASDAHYVFVSTISVYADDATPHQDESAAVRALADNTVEEITGDTYGGLKVLCERAAEAALPGRVTVVRPGLIVGPHDYTDRFPYWVRHMAGAAETLAPGTPEARVQIIDVRDLGEWMVRLAEQRVAGVFNATGTPVAFGALLESMRAALGGRGPITWVDERFLLDRGVVPWEEMPLWVPADSAGFMQTGVSRAIAAGLVFRDLADTARATQAWLDARPPGTPATTSKLTGATMTLERERALLDEWHAGAPARSGP